MNQYKKFIIMAAHREDYIPVYNWLNRFELTEREKLITALIIRNCCFGSQQCSASLTYISSYLKCGKKYTSTLLNGLQNRGIISNGKFIKDGKVRNDFSIEFDIESYDMKQNAINCIKVYNWMISQHGLRGIELRLYAFIYGFKRCTMCASKIAEHLDIDEKNVIKCLSSLTKKGFLTKIPTTKNGIWYNDYIANETPIFK